MKEIVCRLGILLLLPILFSCKGTKTNNVHESVRVKVMTIGAEQVNGEQGYSGTVEEESGSSLSFSTPGTVRSMFVDEGSFVAKGQLLATLDGSNQSNLQNSNAAITVQAHTAYLQALDTYKRSKKLHQEGVISDAKWVTAQTTLAAAKAGWQSAAALEKISAKDSRDTRLVAPFSGYVAMRAADVGQNVVTGQMIVKLVHIDRVKVVISVPEGEISKIRQGETMMVNCEALGNAIYYGKVDERGVSADPLSRTYDVKLIVDNPGHKLLPGMICNVYTRFQRGQTSVFVPATVIQLNPDNRMFVWVVSNGRATKRLIHYVGDTSQGVRVNGGLQPGDQLIIEGQQKVSEGTRCQIVK